MSKIKMQGYSDKLHRKKILSIWLIGIFACFLGLFAMGLGRYPMNIKEVALLIIDKINRAEVNPMAETVVWKVRFPRVLLALLAGAGLSVAGASFQSIFSNPLATPDTLGVATGTSFGAVFGLLMGWNMFYVQTAAMVFGLAAVGVVFVISRIRNERSIIMIVLSGIVVGSIFQAMVSIVKYVADPQDALPAITFWLMGGLSSVRQKTLLFAMPALLTGMVVLFLLRWKLNVLSLNEDEAKTLGVRVGVTRNLAILASTMITAAIISTCGSIGWLGLLVPHICRMIYGNSNIYVIPASISVGAAIFLLIDTLARTATAGEIPVSILTALIGAPFFIFLMRKTGGAGL